MSGTFPKIGMCTIKLGEAFLVRKSKGAGGNSGRLPAVHLPASQKDVLRLPCFAWLDQYILVFIFYSYFIYFYMLQLHIGSSLRLSTDVSTTR